jgi:hypothetical protein
VSHAIDIDALIEEYREGVRQVFRCLCAATALSVLQQQTQELEELQAKLRIGKIAANQNAADGLANEMLGRECLVGAMVHEAKMWIALREGRAHDAWDAFVDAEEHLCVAMRTPISSEFVHLYSGRFERLQAVLFPDMVFVSCGYNHDGGRCTICGATLQSCPHVKGRIYAGQVCAECDMTRFDLDHVAIVAHPMSKHCYITRYRHADEDWTDRLSSEKLPRSGEEKEPTDGSLLTEARLFENKLPVGSRM